MKTSRRLPELNFLVKKLKISRCRDEKTGTVQLGSRLRLKKCKLNSLNSGPNCVQKYAKRHIVKRQRNKVVYVHMCCFDWKKRRIDEGSISWRKQFSFNLKNDPFGTHKKSTTAKKCILVHEVLSIFPQKFSE